jgi:hypothetical protein
VGGALTGFLIVFPPTDSEGAWTGERERKGNARRNGLLVNCLPGLIIFSEHFDKGSWEWGNGVGERGREGKEEKKKKKKEREKKTLPATRYLCVSQLV